MTWDFNFRKIAGKYKTLRRKRCDYDNICVRMILTAICCLSTVGHNENCAYDYFITIKEKKYNLKLNFFVRSYLFFVKVIRMQNIPSQFPMWALRALLVKRIFCFSKGNFEWMSIVHICISNSVFHCYDNTHIQAWIRFKCVEKVYALWGMP